MRVFVLALAMALLVSCNDDDIDGVMEVLTSFTLMDEDGYRLSIAEGTYEADFNYKAHKKRAELEIDDVVAGYDRDFIFGISNLGGSIVTYDMKDGTERVTMHLPSSSTGQTVDAEVVISNTIISKKSPQVYFDRCNAHLGIKGGLAGLFGMGAGDKRKRHSRSGGSIGQRIYTVASYTESELSVSIRFVVGEETVATFEGAERRRYRDLLWVGECGEYDRPVISRD